MNFFAFWDRLLKRFPTLRGAEKVQVSQDTIQRIALEAYEAGFEDGENNKSLFEKMFGR